MNTESTEKFIRQLERELRTELKESTKENIREALNERGLLKSDIIEWIESGLEKHEAQLSEEKEQTAELITRLREEEKRN